MKYTAEILTSAIVVIGNFNPAIFTPDWLELNGLIGEGDADTARDGSQGRDMIITRKVATFESDWFALEVLENKFTLTSKGALSPAFKDLAIGVFQLVSHTPVMAVGLNFMGHFKLANEDDYHRIGDVLAPKKIWQSLYPDDMSGLADLSIRIQHGNRGEKLESNDEKRIAIKPSDKFKFGVFQSYNDHRNISLDNEDDLRPAERVVRIIDSDWESSWGDAVRVFDGVMTMTLEQ